MKVEKLSETAKREAAHLSWLSHWAFRLSFKPFSIMFLSTLRSFLLTVIVPSPWLLTSRFTTFSVFASQYLLDRDIFTEVPCRTTKMSSPLRISMQRDSSICTHFLSTSSLVVTASYYLSRFWECLFNTIIASGRSIMFSSPPPAVVKQVRRSAIISSSNTWIRTRIFSSSPLLSISVCRSQKHTDRDPTSVFPLAIESLYSSREHI